jgi:hypothetical protein
LSLDSESLLSDSRLKSLEFFIQTIIIRYESLNGHF